MTFRITFEELRVFLNLSPHPVDVHLRLWALHLVLWKIRILTPRQQRFCDLAPVAIHHVWLVELDLEEE